MAWTKAVWRNGKRTVTGAWTYYWPSDVFHIELNQKDRTTGDHKRLTTHRDNPEWGNWKLVSDEVKP